MLGGGRAWKGQWPQNYRQKRTEWEEGCRGRCDLADRSHEQPSVKRGACAKF